MIIILILLNIKIEHPNILGRESKENIAINISSTYFCDISIQLDQMGFKENVHYFSIFKPIEKKQQINNDARHKKIVNGYPIPYLIV